MRYGTLIAGLGALVLVLFAASLLIGPAALGLGDSLGALFAGRGEAAVLVMREIRLPRALLGVMLGASLGLSGAAMQGYLRNPLAEPGLIGVSSSAALGAVLALQTGLAASFALALPLMALAGAVLSVLLLLLLAGPRGSSLTLILAGIALSAFAGALTSLVLNLSPNPYAAAEIIFWMLGSLGDRSFTHVWLALPFMALGWVLLATLGRGLDALTLGEDAAAALAKPETIAPLRYCAHARLPGTRASLSKSPSAMSAPSVYPTASERPVSFVVQVQTLPLSCTTGRSCERMHTRLMLFVIRLR